jgi:hypothetical protein
METVRFPIIIKIFSSQTYAFATQWKNKTNSFFCRLRDPNTSSSSAHQLVQAASHVAQQLSLCFSTESKRLGGRTSKYRKKLFTEVSDHFWRNWRQWLGKKRH